MHFYLVALKIVPPNACVENYQNKNSVISYLRLSLLSPLSSDTQPYTKLLQLNPTNKNPQNVIYKFKSYFPHPVHALRIPLCCIFTKIRLLYIAKIRTLIKVSFK